MFIILYTCNITNDNQEIVVLHVYIHIYKLNKHYQEIGQYFIKILSKLQYHTHYN